MPIRLGNMPVGANVKPSKAQALKPLEEAAEVFGAWQRWNSAPNRDRSTMEYAAVVDECADVIQAVCNLLAAIGVDDMESALARCVQRNKVRGRRYEDQTY